MRIRYPYFLIILATLNTGYAEAEPGATELPTEGRIVAGEAAVTQTGSTMHILQSSPNAAIDWNTFNVGAAATVHFDQPSASSVALNRVLDLSNPLIFEGSKNRPKIADFVIAAQNFA